MGGVHVAQLLVRRKRPVPRVPTQPEDHRPLKADGEERMCDDSFRASGVQVTGERISEARGIGHRPARVDLVHQRLS